MKYSTCSGNLLIVYGGKEVHMTREQAAAVTKALNDVEDFEMFMDQIQVAYYNTEGDLSEFFETKMLPLMNAELARRKSALAAM